MERLEDLKFNSVRELYSSPERWHKGDFLNDDETACCLLCALNLVYRKNFKIVNYYDSQRKLIDAIERFYKKNNIKSNEYNRIITFNDEKERTFEDIREVIEDAEI